MYPVNQVFLGGDPLLTPTNPISNIPNIDEQIQYLQKQRQMLEEAQKQRVQNVQPKSLLWDEIDAEVSPMTNEQKERLMHNPEYIETYNKIQSMVQSEILNLVKGRIENTPEGNELLKSQLNIVKRLKGQIIEDTNKEMELFRKFKEFSKTNPGVTYEDFIKANI